MQHITHCKETLLGSRTHCGRLSAQTAPQPLELALHLPPGRAPGSKRHNGDVTDAADFIDSALRSESTWYRADADRERIGGGLVFYGASVGAVRGTVRDASRKFPGQTHDDITALASELWDGAVFERRLAAVVLLQKHVQSLVVTDLTRLEGFVRSAGVIELVDPLVSDVMAPLIARLDERDRARASVAIARWSRGNDEWLRRAGRALSSGS